MFLGYYTAMHRVPMSCGSTTIFNSRHQMLWIDGFLQRLTHLGIGKKCSRQLMLFFSLLWDSGFVLLRPGYTSWLCVPWFLNGSHAILFELQWTLQHAICVNTGSQRCWFRSGNFWWNSFVVFSSYHVKHPGSVYLRPQANVVCSYLAQVSMFPLMH